MRVVVTGGTGFIGSALCARWRDEGADVTVISRARDARPARRLAPGVRLISWLDEPAWREALAAADVVVNLAGASIGRRWTAAYRDTILGSRLQVTRRVVEGMCASQRPGRVLVSASAVGYYGPAGDRALTEDDGAGDDFLATVAARWEAAARPVQDCGVRLVLLRIGTVLGLDGGALPRMVLPFRLGLGASFGHGRQWLSWIHIDDLVRLIMFCAGEASLSGPVNATAPNPVTNAEFTRILARILRRPAPFRVPAWFLRGALGDMATLLLDGQRVLPARAQAAGFHFRFPTLEPALRDLLVGE